jgi:hypothetical protein
MLWLGMCALGIFIGSVITYGLRKTEDWSNPGNVFSSVVGAAVAGAIFTFIKYLGGDTRPEAVALYPVGLAYGMLCINLRWLSEGAATGTSSSSRLSMAWSFSAQPPCCWRCFFLPAFGRCCPHGRRPSAAGIRPRTRSEAGPSLTRQRAEVVLLIRNFQIYSSLLVAR